MNKTNPNNSPPSGHWNFDNSYLTLPETLYSRCRPTPVSDPSLVLFNYDLAGALALDTEFLSGIGGAKIFAGNELPPGSEPIAQAYAGHQYAHFRMLGDGRAILLGEHLTPNKKRFDIQLKGPGVTPYSRRGDGRAALGPMIREYIVSEAMFGLGIPTTRSLAVTLTGESVPREGLFPGAVLMRIAASHIRVGTFEYAAKFADRRTVKSLADYTIWRHFQDVGETEDKYLIWLEQVIERQAKLIAQWQLVGFVHGVMNTDNMAISGESIDFGPCAFMDIYDSETVYSSIDSHGRYSYQNQAPIAQWNLAVLAESLVEILLPDAEGALRAAQTLINGFTGKFAGCWLAGMRKKLGILGEDARDLELANSLLQIMQNKNLDFTNTFWALSRSEAEVTESNLQGISEAGNLDFGNWKSRWLERIAPEGVIPDVSVRQMEKANPWVIPRNHQVEKAIRAAEDAADVSLVNELIDVIKRPFIFDSKHAEHQRLPTKAEQVCQTFCGT